jgi:hypothetical protein
LITRRLPLLFEVPANVALGLSNVYSVIATVVGSMDLANDFAKSSDGDIGNLDTSKKINAKSTLIIVPSVRS